MSLFDLFALLLASLTLSTAVMVVLSRHAIYAAFYLLLTLLGVAAEYALLNAHFVAVIQVLVYAGAVVVLIVFVLMMLGFGREQLKGFQFSGPAVFLPLLLGAVLIAAGGVGLFTGNPLRVKPLPSKHSVTQAAREARRFSTAPPRQAPVQTLATREHYGSIQAVGKHLITHNILAFELISVLLLMAIGGVITLLRESPDDDDLSDSTSSTPQGDTAS